MAKDRYSDDHTFEVVGDTNTINIKDNLTVENDLVVDNDATVSGQLKVNEIAPETGTITTFTQNVVIEDDLDVTSNLHVDVDATITGDLNVTGTIETATGYNGPRNVLFGPANIFHTGGVITSGGAGTTDTISLGGFGFEDTDVLYSIDMLIGESTTPTSYFGPTYIAGLVDLRYAVAYTPSTQIVTVAFIGASWTSTNVNFYMTVWYEET